MLDFQREQLAFIRRIKEPTAPLPSGMTIERMAVYQELFFNNLQNFVNSAFPVLHSLLPAEQWQSLTRQFFQEHRLDSPYFLAISAEFLQWLPTVSLQLPDFALELAHYEWLELSLATAHADAVLPWQFEADSPLYLSPLAHLGCYQYPVHCISAEFQPQQCQPTFILLYRDEQDSVRFIELNAAMAALMQLVDTEPGAVLADYVAWLLPYLPGWTAEQLTDAATPLLQDFARKTILHNNPIHLTD